jgi:2-methylcitrate dehydratase PrpD
LSKANLASGIDARRIVLSARLLLSEACDGQRRKARMTDAAVLRQRATAQLVPDAELENNAAPEAIVEVTLNDGKRLTERVGTVRGTAENPMTRAEVIAKARDLITPVLGAAKGTKLIERILDIESMTSIRELRPLLQPTATTK